MLATGMAVLGGAIYLGSSLLAQQTPPAGAPAQPAAPPQTRIGLINLNYVVKNYSKFLAMQGDMKTVLNHYQDLDKQIAKQMEDKAKEAEAPTATPQVREKVENDLKNLKRNREDNTAAGKKALSEKSDQVMVTLYIEVYNATQRYATAHGLDLVMHYNDALDQTDLWGAANIQRKLQAGACIPLHFNPGMDISKQVVDLLNQSYQAGLQKPAPTTGAPTSTSAPGADHH
jgi:Skp family chaperone for outer membrane proteins